MRVPMPYPLYWASSRAWTAGNEGVRCEPWGIGGGSVGRTCFVDGLAVVRRLCECDRGEGEGEDELHRWDGEGM